MGKTHEIKLGSHRMLEKLFKVLPSSGPSAWSLAKTGKSAIKCTIPLDIRTFVPVSCAAETDLPVKINQSTIKKLISGDKMGRKSTSFSLFQELTRPMTAWFTGLHGRELAHSCTTVNEELEKSRQP